jgi:hypothetical protein
MFVFLWGCRPTAVRDLSLFPAFAAFLGFSGPPQVSLETSHVIQPAGHGRELDMMESSNLNLGASRALQGLMVGEMNVNAPQNTVAINTLVTSSGTSFIDNPALDTWRLIMGSATVGINGVSGSGTNGRIQANSITGFDASAWWIQTTNVTTSPALDAPRRSRKSITTPCSPPSPSCPNQQQLFLRPLASVLATGCFTFGSCIRSSVAQDIPRHDTTSMGHVRLSWPPCSMPCEGPHS